MPRIHKDKIRNSDSFLLEMDCWCEKCNYIDTQMVLYKKIKNSYKSPLQYNTGILCSKCMDKYNFSEREIEKTTYDLTLPTLFGSVSRSIDSDLKNQIDNIIIRCPYNNYCDKHSPLYLLEIHDCIFKHIYCRWCNEQYIKRDKDVLDKHEKDECKKRPIKCNKCGLTDKHERMVDHKCNEFL